MLLNLEKSIPFILWNINVKPITIKYSELRNFCTFLSAD